MEQIIYDLEKIRQLTDSVEALESSLDDLGSRLDDMEARFAPEQDEGPVFSHDVVNWTMESPEHIRAGIKKREEELRIVQFNRDINSFNYIMYDAMRNNVSHVDVDCYVKNMVEFKQMLERCGYETVKFVDLSKAEQELVYCCRFPEDYASGKEVFNNTYHIFVKVPK